jgi:hypothetical protein
VGDVIVGATADPGIALAVAGIDPEALRAASAEGFRMYDFATRGLGLALTLFALLYLTVLLRPYRSGERWAWAAAWLLPAWAIVVPVLYVGYGTQADQPPAPPMVSGPIVAVLAAVALLVDRRRFAS